jgi:hypothetical protein
MERRDAIPSMQKPLRLHSGGSGFFMGGGWTAVGVELTASRSSLLQPTSRSLPDASGRSNCSGEICTQVLLKPARSCESQSRASPLTWSNELGIASMIFAERANICGTCRSLSNTLESA